MAPENCPFLLSPPDGISEQDALTILERMKNEYGAGSVAIIPAPIEIKPVHVAFFDAFEKFLDAWDKEDSGYSEEDFEEMRQLFLHVKGAEP